MAWASRSLRKREKERDKEIDRQKDRQTDRTTDKQKERDRDTSSLYIPLWPGLAEVLERERKRETER